MRHLRIRAGGPHLASQGRRRCASRGGEVFPRGQRRRRSNPNVTVVELTTQAGMRRLCRVLRIFLVDALAPTLLV